MKRIPLLLTALAVVALSGATALAGEHAACTASTQACLDKMASYLASAGWAGMEGEYDEEKGLFTVNAVADRSPAAAAGLHAGDVIYGVNGQKFAKMDEADWAAYRETRVAGNEVVYLVKNAEGKREFALTLAHMPEDLVAKKLGKHMSEHAQVASVQ